MSVATRPCLLGVPWDRSSSYERGAAAAPPLIRQALWSASTNSATELGIAIEPNTVDDAGDLALGEDGAEARAAIEVSVRGILARQRLPVVLGGDHSISYPVLRAWRDQPVAAILHIDAHGDLYDEFPLPEPGQPRGLGDPYSHACPFARIMEEGLSSRLVQVGVRTMTPHLAAQAARFGVEVYGMDRWRNAPVETLQGPLYVSLDLDGLDPAFAPGVAHPEPGGLSTRDVVDLLHRIQAPIAGIDIVEYNPRHDHRDLTARVAAKLLKELVAVAVRNGPAT
jgi:arginase